MTEHAVPMMKGEGFAVITCAKSVELDDWEVLAEIRPTDVAKGLDLMQPPAPPVIVIKQHNQTKELRIDIYDCIGGLQMTQANFGVDFKDKSRADYFRELKTCRNTTRPLRVRFMCPAPGSNLKMEI